MYRSILYERLSSRQSFPNTHPTPSNHSYQTPHALPYSHHQSRDAGEPNLVVVDTSDPTAVDWYRSRGIPIRVMTGSDGQPVQVAEMTSAPPSTPGSHTPTSTPSRYGPGHRDSRQQAPPPPTSVQHLEPSHTYDRHQSSYPHPPTTSPHYRSRSRGAHPSAPLQTLSSGYSHPQQGPPEASSPTYRDYPPGYHTSERERRAHRSGAYDAPSSRLQPPGQPLPASHSPSLHSRSPSNSRGSSNQIHNHQRMGPATNISNYGPPDREHDRELRDREREQDWERERERGSRSRDWEREREGNEVTQRGGTPPYAGPRSRYAIDDRDGYVSHAREHRGYHHNDVPHPAVSRSLSPRSRSASPPRRSPRDAYYEREVSNMRPQVHGSGVELDTGRRALPAHSEGELERDIDMEDVRDRAPEPAD